MDLLADQPVRVVVEVVTPEVVTRLTNDNVALREELARLQQQHNSLHATVYRFMDQFVELKRSLKGMG